MSTSDGKSRQIEILLVEDNPGDARLTQEAMREAKMTNVLHVVEDGEQAMDFLRRCGQFKDAPRPDLILLDLNLPKKDGRAVLAEVKGDPDLKRIPVDYVKIDQAFIRGLGEGGADAAITRAIIAMAHGLSLRDVVL